METASVKYLARCVVTPDGVSRDSVVSIDGAALKVEPFERETSATVFVDGIVVAARRDLALLPESYREPEAIWRLLPELPPAAEVNLKIIQTR